MHQLRPGRPVLRRDAHTLQVGLTHPVLLPDRPAIGALLAALRPDGPQRSPCLHVSKAAGGHVDEEDPGVRDALQRLDAGGHLAAGADEPAPGAVAVRAFGPGLEERAAESLDLAGLARDDAAEVVLVVAAGPVPRAVPDELVAVGVPHLLASSIDGGWRVGPFVVPGTTACLRCVDAHESAADPRRPLVLAQAARAAQEDPPPSDPLSERWALAWAARDLRTYLADGEPGTWSATYDLPAPEEPCSAPVHQRWLRHPECGCSWDLLIDLP